MSRKRVGVAVAIALLAGLLLFLAVRSPDPGSASAPDPAPADRTAPSQARSDRAVPPQRLVAATEPVVEEISVEKTEVCSGEDNLVTVRLAGNHRNDETIRITMPGLAGAGRQMPFILGLTAAKQQPEMPEVVVSGRDGVIATVKIPTVTVKDCTPGPSLSVEVAPVANTSATFALTATVRNPGPTPFKPVQWQWDFGDGRDATTKVRTVEHGYEDRLDKTRASIFLVHVRAADADGVELLGRHALDVMQSKKVVVINTELGARLPVLDADGRVTQRVRIHHASDQPITLERVEVQRFRDNAQGVEEMLPTDVDPRQVLGTNVIPPGRGIETTAVLDTRAEPRTKRLTFDLRGKSADGIRASGRFSVLRASEPSPPEEREAVADAQVKAALAAARKKLGRDEVSLDDMVRLKREGALDNLPAADGAQTPPSAAAAADEPGAKPR
jgi:hypothetical protein